VRWRRVDSFFESTPHSRHYTIDYVTGIIRFGDGRKGMVPPEGKNNIVAASYRIGGGSNGNVNPGTITSLSRALAYIDSVTNPLPATGGSDRESVEEAKTRAPFTIKSRDRAVTAEDFEMLALRASTALARAKCVPDRTNRGHVTLVVVPKGETRKAEDLGRRLVPSNEVLRYVKRYLDDRKLRRFLHPLVGGRSQTGWDFGRPVLKTELVHLIEEVPGVEGVDSLDIRDEQRDVGVEHMRLDDDELPFLVHVHIAEKVRDEIR
jgi:hypothetical protein